MLAAVYAATLAPGVTLWDAGELVAAVHTFGIPHPPGTPLWVLAARAWRLALSPLPTALASNLFSAACTAAAGALLALLLARSMRAPLAALGGALCAGAMSTVWMNATETEVYAASLLLSMVMLVAGERAGATGESRWRVLLAYLMGLAVPLHLSALVAAPAAIAFAVQDARGTIRWRDAATLLGVAVAAGGAGLASPVIAFAGVALAVAGRLRSPVGASAPALAALLGAVALALTALAVLPIRAAHDPVLNAGNPVTWRALWDVVGRAQYGGTPIWPRQAPLWTQLGNVLEYADWQVALGLAPGVAPSWWRTPVTLGFVALGVHGAMRHRQLDRRGFRAFAVLLLSGTVGIAVYMNFKAGASFGYGVLPATAPHEVRERDYFFSLGFVAWGAWAGTGAVLLARRVAPALAPVGVLVAALPIALGWRATDRRRPPESDTARAVGRAMLWSAPRDAVLLTAGDNDSFPLWYAQTVEGERPDVLVVTVPMLGAPWYRAQLVRRDSLLSASDVAAPPRESVLVPRIAARARARGRPVAVALTADSAVRALASGGGGEWVLHGLVWVMPARDGDTARVMIVDGPVDTAAARAFVARFGRAAAAASPRSLDDAVDPAPWTMARLLGCPAEALAAARGEARVDSLDSSCKWR